MANNRDGAKTPVDAFGLEVLRYVAENDPSRPDKYRFRVGGNITTSATPPAKTPTTKRIAIVAADVEQSYAFPAGTKRFRMYNDGATKIRYAYATGLLSTDYNSLYPSTDYCESDLDDEESFTLYFTSKKAGDIIELVSWC